MDSTRLLESLDGDYRRLRDTASGADLGARVPSCPDWTVADLVRHVALVYLHKVVCMREGKPTRWPPPGLDDEEPLALLDRTYADLMAQFATRSPESPSYTWYAPDQSVGFWIRRMAQETVIHRVDAELGAGVPVADIPPDLAIDGIDEFMFTYLEYGSRTWREDFATVLAAADGRAVRVEVPGSAWLVRPTSDAVDVRVADGGETAAATVRGEPSEVLLWLWGRTGPYRPFEGSQEGDADAVAYLRQVLATGSQ